MFELRSQKALLQVKLLAPYLAETEFAKTAHNITDFSYRQSYRRYHTSDEMAQFLLELYDSDQVVGSVDRNDFTYTLSGVKFNYGLAAKDLL